MLERASETSGDTHRLPGGMGNIMEEHGKLWAIATLLFVIAIIGYVLQD